MNNTIATTLLCGPAAIPPEYEKPVCSLAARYVTGFSLSGLYKMDFNITCNELYDADRNWLLEIASATETALRQAANYTKANRSSIRSSGLRWLRKELKRILKERGYYDSDL